MFIIILNHDNFSKSPAQYSLLYRNLVKEKYADEILNPSIHGGYQPLFIDAMWATALALNATEGSNRCIIIAHIYYPSQREFCNKIVVGQLL